MCACGTWRFPNRAWAADEHSAPIVNEGGVNAGELQDRRLLSVSGSPGRPYLAGRR
jgi:hypothetical protein